MGDDVTTIDVIETYKRLMPNDRRGSYFGVYECADGERRIVYICDDIGQFIAWALVKKEQYDAVLRIGC